MTPAAVDSSKHTISYSVLIPHGAGLMTWQNQHHQQSLVPSTGNIKYGVCDEQEKKKNHLLPTLEFLVTLSSGCTL